MTAWKPAPSRRFTFREIRSFCSMPGMREAPRRWKRPAQRPSPPAAGPSPPPMAMAMGEKVPLDLAMENLARIVGATSLPVSVDIESGYGDAPEAVAQTCSQGHQGGRHRRLEDLNRLGHNSVTRCAPHCSGCRPSSARPFRCSSTTRCGFATESIIDIDEASVDRMLAVGFKGIVWTTQAAAEQMQQRGGGAIINLSSIAALNGMAEGSVYSALKAAVAGYTRAAAVELGPLGHPRERGGARHRRHAGVAGQLRRRHPAAEDRGHAAAPLRPARGDGGCRGLPWPSPASSYVTGALWWPTAACPSPAPENR